MQTCEDVILEYFADLHEQHGIINPSIAQICAAVKYKERRVQTAIQNLIKQGKITRTVDRRVNSRQCNTPIYYLTSLNNAPPIYSTKNFDFYAETDADKSVWHGPENTTDTKYWQFMELIERNTEAWCKQQAARPTAATAPVQQALHFPPDPDFYACFFWHTHEQAA